MRSQATMDRAALGVRAIYHICPNVSPDEVSLGRTAISAAQNNNLGHFVYHSVLHPQTEAMPHHWQKLRVEEQLLESGLRFTILQPAAYMQNILAYWDQIVGEGILPVPYAEDTRLGLVDLGDVAVAAAIVLTDAGHEGATYELTGVEALSQTEVVTILSQELRRPVRVQSIALDVWQQRARATGLGAYQIKALTGMFRYYESFGFWGNPHVLGWLLGRQPTSFEEFVQQTIMDRLG
jgi:uncharacterized protein YbjT (DUF2867 family)